MTKENQLEFLKAKCTVPYNLMIEEPFIKYYRYIDGVYPRNEWKEERILSEMTDEEFYKMVALCSFDSSELYKRIVKRIEKANIEWWKLPILENEKADYYNPLELL